MQNTLWGENNYPIGTNQQKSRGKCKLVGWSDT